MSCWSHTFTFNINAAKQQMHSLLPSGFCEQVTPGKAKQLEQFQNTKHTVASCAAGGATIATCRCKQGPLLSVRICHQSGRVPKSPQVQSHSQPFISRAPADKNHQTLPALKAHEHHPNAQCT
jgi:hypothetical protein